MTFDVESLTVSDTHRKVAAFIATETGKKPTPQTVALVLALTEAYKKSDAAREEREARRKEREEAAQRAREKKEARLAAKIAEARKIAESLGLNLTLGQDLADLVEPAPVEEPEDETPAVTVVEVADPEPTPVAAAEKSPAKRKTTRGNTIAAVPDADEITPIGEPEADPRNDTSAIVVEEASDKFAEVTEPGEATDDFFEGDDEEEY